MKSFFKFLAVLSVLVSCEEEDQFLEPHNEITHSTVLEDEYLRQNRWTYSMMKYHYFWYRDMPDSTKLDFESEPRAFFNSLLSPEDRFSWIEAYDGYVATTEYNHGFEWQKVKLSSGESVCRVLYVTDPALAERGLKRGDYVSEPLDGRITIYSLLGGVLEVADCIELPSAQTRADNVAPTVQLDTVYVVGGKRIGYAVYDEFADAADFRNVIYYMLERSIDDLILDLRYNHGGLVSTCNEIASYIVDKSYLGSIFQIQRYNDLISSTLRTETNPQGYDYVYLQSSSYVLNHSLDMKRLVVLATKNTASASESLVIGLRSYIPVYVIGSRTCGKDVGSYNIHDSKYKYSLQPITFRYYNADGDSTDINGLVPDIEVEDDLDHKRGNLNERMLASAIEFLTGVNPSQADTAQYFQQQVGYSSIQQKIFKEFKLNRYE